MTLYPSDLAFMTPDSDGIIRLYRGTTKQVEIEHPSFIGDVRLYRGLQSSIGVGPLRGWALVGEVSEGTLLRVATTDAEVGVVSGSNTITVPIPTISPTGTVDLDHDHGDELSEQAGIGASTSFEDSGVLPGTGIEIALRPHVHPINIAPLGADVVDLNIADVVIAPIEVEIAPQAISFWLITYTGVIVE